jgi:sugar/nucleoside kinase (ribokinase family)
MLTTLGCAIELEPEHLFTDVIANSTHLHLTGYVFTGGRMTATAELALEHARAHGVKVSFDVADPWVVRTHRDLMWKVIERYASVVFVNAEEARALCGVEPEEAIFELSERCEVAVVKLGSRGSIVRSRGVTHPIPVYPVKAIDSTGAGDAYAGGFLHGLVRGYDLVRCGHIGSRVAAETVTQAGAVVGQPGRLHDLVHSLNFPD